MGNLTDLNNCLFETLENLNKADLKEKELAEAITKAEAVTKVSETIIKNSELILKAVTVMNRLSGGAPKEAQLLIGTSKDDANEEI